MSESKAKNGKVPEKKYQSVIGAIFVGLTLLLILAYFVQIFMAK